MAGSSRLSQVLVNAVTGQVVFTAVGGLEARQESRSPNRSLSQLAVRRDRANVDLDRWRKLFADYGLHRFAVKIRQRQPECFERDALVAMPEPVLPPAFQLPIGQDFA
jgi:hypothetical protein